MKDGTTTVSTHELGDITAHYETDANGKVALWLYPTSRRSALASRRATVGDETWVRDPARAPKAYGAEPLVQIKLSEDDQPAGFGQGRSQLWSPTNDRFRLVDQRITADAVETELADDTGLRLTHRLSSGPYGLTLKSSTTFTNESDRPVRLELLTSFAVSGITPFATDDAPDRMALHRFRTSWAAEGRLVSDTIEDLHLERSFAGNTHYSERFGSVGSMPVKGFAPTALVEDTVAGVVWGARLASPTSWQMEVGRLFDDLVFTGGLADREFGHWTKQIEPAESFTAPDAWLTCVAGSVDDACERLVTVDIPAAEAGPAIEQDLPIVFNEWCTSWGQPTEEQVLEIADKIAPLGVRFLVIDAGWYAPSGESAAGWVDHDDVRPTWFNSFGDWTADPGRFPNGLAATAAAIRSRGLIPGIWFEPEFVGTLSDAFQDTDHLLARDGRPLTIGTRRAWDLNDPYVTAYLDERMIRVLREADFGYLALDYSETLGLGVDDPDGLGEGLRRQGEGALRLYEHIADELPEIVINTVSAAGHRMEASFLQRSATTLSSDAHETVELPIIAASLHRLILPRQSLLWTVLRPSDSRQRMTYTLATSFLGRMCLSGNIVAMDDGQISLIAAATGLYRRAAPVIKDGSSRLHGETGASWRHPSGWQAVVRTSGDRGVVVLHTFQDSPNRIDIPLPGAGWTITGSLAESPWAVDGDRLIVTDWPDFSGEVLIIEREGTAAVEQPRR